jgi:hypothetical protein
MIMKMQTVVKKLLNAMMDDGINYFLQKIPLYNQPY